MRHLQPRQLRRVQLQNTKKRRKRRCDHLPSLLLSNVRSLPNKLDEIQTRISSIKPNIVILTESWLDDTYPDASITIDGYSIIRRDRVTLGGGIICFLSNSFECKVLSSQDIPSLSVCATEFLVMIIRDLRLLLIGIYHPFWGNSSRNEAALACITDIIDCALTDHLDSHSARIILCGDFNDLRHSYDTISSLTGLTPLVKWPTRGSHVLDQVFVNFAIHSDDIQVLSPFGSSDHATVLWTPSHPARSNISTKVKVRTFTRKNKNIFLEKICAIDWCSMVSSVSNLDEASLQFLETVSTTVEECFPSRIVRFRPTDPPWFRPSLKILIDERDRAFSNKRWERYQRLRREVKKHILHLKSNYLDSMTSQGPRSKWKCLKQLGRTDRSRHGGAKISVDEFNSVFASAFQSPTNPSVILDDLPHEQLSVSLLEVHHELRRLKRRSCGPDGIPYWIFRDFSHIFVEAVTTLFNRCLLESHFPRCFKDALITPVPKCDSPTMPMHYRPISRLSILSKVFERLLVRKWIAPIMVTKAKPNQFAYIPRTGSGTASALTLLNHMIVEFLDRPGAIRLLAVDYSRAFDKIHHRAIIDAMIRFRMPKMLVLLMNDYLRNRRQRVQIGDAKSDWCDITSGVPQGSVVGPLLFNMVTDSYSPACENTKVIKYADDVTIVHLLRQSVDDHLQLEWNHLIKWSDENALPVNRDKCAVMNVVTRKGIFLSDVVTDSGMVLSTVSSLKLLGVTFSDNCKWNIHVTNVVRKASRRIFIIRNLKRSGCPPNTLFLAYTAFIRSVLLYGFPAFCNLSFYLMQRLERVERRIFRLIGQPDTLRPSLIESSQDLCRKLFSQVTVNEHHPLRSLFLSRVPTARNALTLKPPFARTKRFKDSFIKFGAR